MGTRVGTAVEDEVLEGSLEPVSRESFPLSWFPCSQSKKEQRLLRILLMCLGIAHTVRVPLKLLILLCSQYSLFHTAVQKWIAIPSFTWWI